jgi:O-antigen/teichoic acid export membrane protein
LSGVPSHPLKRLSSRASWGLASWALPLVVVFLVSPKLLHAIGPSRFGVLMITLVTPLIAIQLEFGITSAAVRRLAARFVVGPVDAGTTLLTLFVALSVIGITLGGGVWAAARPISHWLGFVEVIGEGPGHDLVRACAIWVAASLVLLMPAIVARAAQAMILTAATQTMVTVVLWLGALYLVRQGAPLENVVWLGLVLSAVSAAVTLFAMRRYVDWGGPVHFAPRLLAEDARFSAGMFAAQAASAFVYQGDRMLVSILGSPAMAGLYVLCTSIASKTTAAVGALSSFVFPHAAGLQSAGRHSGVFGLVHALDRAVATLLIPLLLPGLMLAGPFLKLWLGDFGTPELTATFRILLIAFAIPAFAMPVSHVLVASGVSGLSAGFAWLTVVVALGSMTWLIPRLGLAGAAYAMLFGNATSLVFALMARRSLGLPPAPDRGRFWLGLLLGVAAQLGLLVWLARSVASWPGLLVTAAAAWSVFYIVRAIVAALSPEETQLLQRLSAAMRR